MKITAAVVSALGLLVGAAAAHDLYLMPAQFRVPAGMESDVVIHNGDAFPVAATSTRLDRLQNPAVHTSKGSLPLTNLRQEGKQVRATVPAISGHAAITVAVPANVEGMVAFEFLEYLEEEGLDSIIAWRKEHAEGDAKERYAKYAKTLVLAGQGDDGFARPTGLPIEFIPVTDPFAAKPGGSLSFQVLFRGKPAPAGLQVVAASTLNPKPTPIGRTDASGKIAVAIPEAGTWRLHTLYMERMADTSVAEWESFWATLTFEIR